MSFDDGGVLSEPELPSADAGERPKMLCFGAS